MISPCPKCKTAQLVAVMPPDPEYIKNHPDEDQETLWPVTLRKLSAEDIESGLEFFSAYFVTCGCADARYPTPKLAIEDWNARFRANDGRRNADTDEAPETQEARTFESDGRVNPDGATLDQ
jgi:hypothetical protein